MLKADGFNDAIIGTTANLQGEQIAVYDRGICINLLKRQGMTHGDAVDYFEYNIAGSYMGENTPIFIDAYRAADATKVNWLKERLREMLEAAKEVMGQTDNQEPTHPATIEKLGYAIENSTRVLKDTASMSEADGSAGSLSGPH